MYAKRALAKFDLEPQEPVVELSLAGRLKALGLVPIDNASVDAYQEKMVWREYDVRGHMLVRTAVVAVLAAAVVAGYVVLGPAAGLPDLSGFAFPIFFLAFVGFAVRLTGLLLMGTARGSRWLKMPYNDFAAKHNVPPEIADRAAAIRAAMPEAVIEVEYFKRDPFLTVLHERQKAYVGVWDERGFA